MKTVKMEVPVELAKRLLAGFDAQIATKRRDVEALNVEISELEESAKTMRAQLKNGNAEVAPRGDNRNKILEYLSNIPDNKGARASEITKATGIGASSTAFTLTHYTKDFVR